MSTTGNTSGRAQRLRGLLGVHPFRPVHRVRRGDALAGGLVALAPAAVATSPQVTVVGGAAVPTHAPSTDQMTYTISIGDGAVDAVVLHAYQPDGTKSLAGCRGRRKTRHRPTPSTRSVTDCVSGSAPAPTRHTAARSTSAITRSPSTPTSPRCRPDRRSAYAVVDYATGGGTVRSRRHDPARASRHRVDQADRWRREPHPAARHRYRRRLRGDPLQQRRELLGGGPDDLAAGRDEDRSWIRGLPRRPVPQRGRHRWDEARLSHCRHSRRAMRPRSRAGRARAPCSTSRCSRRPPRTSVAVGTFAVNALSDNGLEASRGDNTVRGSVRFTGTAHLVVTIAPHRLRVTVGQHRTVGGLDTQRRAESRAEDAGHRRCAGRALHDPSPARQPDRGDLARRTRRALEGRDDRPGARRGRSSRSERARPDGTSCSSAPARRPATRRAKA